MALLSDNLRNRILGLPTSLRSRFRVTAYRALGASIGRNCKLARVMIPYCAWDVQMGDNVTLDNHTVLLIIGKSTGTRRLTFGNRIYCNRFSMFDAAESVTIGDEVMIGPHCYITDHDHGTVRGIPIYQQPLVSKPTRIEKSAWLGAHVVVLKGVTIGEGAIIAAGAVVTKDIPPFTIAGGTPAKVLRDR